MINLFKYSPQADLLKDKVIMISGSSSGVGKEAAITFAKFGAKTILLARKPIFLSLKAIKTIFLARNQYFWVSRLKKTIFLARKPIFLSLEAKKHDIYS